MTRDRWLLIVDSLLRPRRPDLARCLALRDAHVQKRQAFSEARGKELQGNIDAIQRVRDAVFAAKDGVVPSEMTRLEREWKALMRRDPDDALMDLWAELTPRSWHDRKVWRDAKQRVQMDIAVAIAADLDAIERAEAAAKAFAAACTAWGKPIGSAVRFAPFDTNVRPVSAVLVPLLPVDREKVRVARDLEREVHRIVRGRFPDRAGLARDVALAAAFDVIAEDDPKPNPARALYDLWNTGYALLVADETAVTMEIPPLRDAVDAVDAVDG